MYIRMWCKYNMLYYEEWCMLFSTGKCKAGTLYSRTNTLVPIMFGFAHGQIYIELAPHSLGVSGMYVEGRFSAQ